MTATPRSGLTSYCTPDEAVLRVDVRSLGDYLSDSGTRLTPQQVSASPVFAALLLGASGEAEAAVLAGDRYSPDDLAALLAANNASAEYLKDVIAWLAFGRAWARRPRTAAGELPVMVQWAQQQVELLRTGQHVLGFIQHQDAGVLNIQPITAQEVRQRNFATSAARRMLGQRGDQTYPPLF